MGLFGWFYRKKGWYEWARDGIREGDWSSEKVDEEKVAVAAIVTTATAVAAGKGAEAAERMTREEAEAAGKRGSKE